MIFCDYPIIGSEKDLPVYLINMGLQQCQDHVIRRNGYPCPQILFCTKGSGTLLYDDKKYLIPANTALFLPSDFPHEYYPNEDVWNIHWIVPAGEALPQLLGNLSLEEPGIFIYRKPHGWNTGSVPCMMRCARTVCVAITAPPDCYTTSLWSSTSPSPSGNPAAPIIRP